MPTVLIIEDERLLAQNIADALAQAGHETAIALSGESGLSAVEQYLPDVILLDLKLPAIDGLEVLHRLSAQHSACVILMTAHGDIHTAVQAMKAGAADFLAKPLDLDELQLVVERVLAHRRQDDKLRYFREREHRESELQRLIGESPPMLELKAVLRRIISTPALAAHDAPSLLITGETGTGKDLIARVLHYCGPRREGQFVQVNCTAVPAALFESELFGHVQGAFTSARSEKRGLFEVADGGTLFLDEIGDLRLDLQVKLLSALDERCIRPVGATRGKRVDVHIIAATNRPLQAAVEAGQFREDLFHRLRVLRLHVPPLRDRGADVLLLAGHFLRAVSSRFGIEVTEFSPEARAALQSYAWPGNVRELVHVVENAVLITDGRTIRKEHLNLSEHPSAVIHIDIPDRSRSIVVDFSEGGPRLEDIEYRIIQAALEYSKYNITRAARILGVSRDALRYRKERYDARRSPSAEADPAPP